MSWAVTLEQNWCTYILQSYAVALLMLHMWHCRICFDAVFCTVVSSFVLFLCCSESLLHRLVTAIIHWCLSCFVLLCSVFCPFFSLCILSWLPVSGAFCVFSCACPSPSRSEHWGAHSDPSGGETSADQSPAQAGGRQRYGLRLNRIYLGRICWVSFCFMKLQAYSDRNRLRERKKVGEVANEYVEAINSISIPFPVLNTFWCGSSLDVVP